MNLFDSCFADGYWVHVILQFPDLIELVGMCLSLISLPMSWAGSWRACIQASTMRVGTMFSVMAEHSDSKNLGPWTPLWGRASLPSWIAHLWIICENEISICFPPATIFGDFPVIAA